MGLNKDFPLYMISMTVSSVIAMLCCSLICAKFCGGMKSCIEKYEKKAGFFENFLLVVFGFSGCVTVNFVLSIISMFVPFFESGSDMSFFENTDLFSTVLALTAIALAPAVCEEIAFRGFVMGSLADFGQKFAVLFSSFIFGMMHGTLSGMVFAFLVGLLLSFIRRLSGSLIPSMTVHFLNNAYAVLMTVFLKTLDIEIFSIISGMFIFIMLLLFAVMLIIFCNKKSVLSAFSTGDCVLTNSEKAKIVLTRPLFWVLIVLAVVFIFLR